MARVDFKYAIYWLAGLCFAHGVYDLFHDEWLIKQGTSNTKPEHRPWVLWPL
jgi:hypothetical protein